MARRTPRFNRLNKLLKATNGTASSGEVFEYQRFLQGINRIDVQRRPSGRYLQIIGVGVIPFGDYPSTGTGKAVKVGITAQADAIRSVFGTALGNNDLGIERTAANIIENPGSFYPALLKITLAAAAATADTETSGVTRRSYKRIKGRSGSIPFGRTITATPDSQTNTALTAIADVDEQDVKKALISKITGAVNADTRVLTTTPAYKLLSFSFDSEVFRANKSDSYIATPSASVGIPAN